MGIYIALVCLILFMMLLDHSRSRYIDVEARSIILLRIVFVAIYFVCALKASSVGRDIPGYASIYEITKSIEFSNFNYVYFENGYILLMKLCVLLHMDVQMFFAVAYFLVIYPIYRFIKEFSEDKIFSSLIYVCYMIFEFDLTGLRQAIAMSTVLIGIMSILKNRKHKIIEFVVFVLLASTFHKSALISLVLLLLMPINNLLTYSLIMVAATGFSIALRSSLLQFIKNFFGKATFNVGASLYIGMNIVFMVSLAVLIVVLQVYCGCNDNYSGYEVNLRSDEDGLLTKAFLWGIVVAVFFGMETAARSFMYFSQVIFVLLPNMLSKFENRSKFILYSFLIVFFIAFFYANSLSGGGFDIVPYRFFWQGQS